MKRNKNITLGNNTQKRDMPENIVWQYNIIYIIPGHNKHTQVIRSYYDN